MITEAIIITITTLSAGVLVFISKLIYSSKCTDIKCCGCEIKRDITKETSIRNIKY